MPRWILPLVLSVAVTQAEQKLTFDERVEIVRGLMAEFATTKVPLPKSKKPLPYEATGKYDAKAWEEIGKEQGPAARVGDLIQVTKVTLESDKILLEINGGVKSGRSWRDRIEIGMGNSTSPVSSGGTATAGTYIMILF